MEIKKFFYNLFNLSRKLKNVKSGDTIIIQHSNMEKGIGEVLCINNEPNKKKILVMIFWNNIIKISGELDSCLFILNYDADELSNFSLLNPVYPINIDSLYDKDALLNIIRDKKNELNLAISDEEYENAQIIEKEILELKEKLFKNKNTL